MWITLCSSNLLENNFYVVLRACYSGEMLIQFATHQMRQDRSGSHYDNGVYFDARRDKTGNALQKALNSYKERVKAAMIANETP